MNSLYKFYSILLLLLIHYGQASAIYLQENSFCVVGNVALSCSYRWKRIRCIDVMEPLSSNRQKKEKNVGADDVAAADTSHKTNMPYGIIMSFLHIECSLKSTERALLMPVSDSVSNSARMTRGAYVKDRSLSRSKLCNLMLHLPSSGCFA